MTLHQPERSRSDPRGLATLTLAEAQAQFQQLGSLHEGNLPYLAAEARRRAFGLGVAADFIMSDSTLRLVDNWHKFAPDDPGYPTEPRFPESLNALFRGYARGVIARVAMEYWRKPGNRRAAASLDDFEPPDHRTASVLDEVVAKESSGRPSRLELLFEEAKLGDGDRALALNHAAGLTIEALAESLGVRAAALRKRHSRAMQRLADAAGVSHTRRLRATRRRRPDREEVLVAAAGPPPVALPAGARIAPATGTTGSQWARDLRNGGLSSMEIARKYRVLTRYVDEARDGLA